MLRGKGDNAFFHSSEGQQRASYQQLTILLRSIAVVWMGSRGVGVPGFAWGKRGQRPLKGFHPYKCLRINTQSL